MFVCCLFNKLTSSIEAGNKRIILAPHVQKPVKIINQFVKWNWIDLKEMKAAQNKIELRMHTKKRNYRYYLNFK